MYTNTISQTIQPYFHIINSSFNPYLTRIYQWQLIKVSYRQNKSVLQKSYFSLWAQISSKRTKKCLFFIHYNFINILKFTFLLLNCPKCLKICRYFTIYTWVFYQGRKNFRKTPNGFCPFSPRSNGVCNFCQKHPLDILKEQPMHPKEMSSDNSSQRYTILNFAKVSVRHRGIALNRVRYVKRTDIGHLDQMCNEKTVT